MARAMRSQIPTSCLKAESSALSVSSRKPSLVTPSLRSSTNRSLRRSTPDPLFSFSLARISLGLTCGEVKLLHSVKPSSREQEEWLHFSGYPDLH